MLQEGQASSALDDDVKAYFTAGGAMSQCLIHKPSKKQLISSWRDVSE